MNEIVYMIKKSISARIFVVVALSLAMAVAVGGGWHSTQVSKLDAAGNVEKAASAPATNSLAGDNAPKTSAFDQALRDMALQDRQQRQATTNQTTSQPVVPAQTNNKPAQAANVQPATVPATPGK